MVVQSATDFTNKMLKLTEFSAIFFQIIVLASFLVANEIPNKILINGNHVESTYPLRSSSLSADEAPIKTYTLVGHSNQSAIKPMETMTNVSLSWNDDEKSPVYGRYLKKKYKFWEELLKNKYVGDENDRRTDEVIIETTGADDFPIISKSGYSSHHHHQQPHSSYGGGPYSIATNGQHGFGVGGLHFLDPLFLVTTLVFVAILVNTILGLIDRVRLPLPTVLHARNDINGDEKPNIRSFTNDKMLDDIEEMLKTALDRFEMENSDRI